MIISSVRSHVTRQVMLLLEDLQANQTPQVLNLARRFRFRFIEHWRGFVSPRQTGERRFPTLLDGRLVLSMKGPHMVNEVAGEAKVRVAFGAPILQSLRIQRAIQLRVSFVALKCDWTLAPHWCWSTKHSLFT